MSGNRCIQILNKSHLMSNLYTVPPTVSVIKHEFLPREFEIPRLTPAEQCGVERLEGNKESDIFISRTYQAVCIHSKPSPLPKGRPLMTSLKLEGGGWPKKQLSTKIGH